MESIKKERDDTLKALQEGQGNRAVETKSE